MRTVLINRECGIIRAMVVLRYLVGAVVTIQLAFALPLHRHPSPVHDCAPSCARDDGDCLLCAAIVPASPVPSIGTPVFTPVYCDAPVVTADLHCRAEAHSCEARAPPFR